jgi:sigma-B regulation protein RsbU (phosphoserine phosphatase)
VTRSSILANVDSEGNTVISAPAEVAIELNRRFPMEQQGDLYFTIFYGVLNRKTGVLQYISAGHVPPVVFPADGPARFLPAEGYAIGWVDEIDVDEQTVTVRPGDRLFVFSDGVPEAMDKDLEQLGDARLLEAISETKGKSIDDAVRHLKTTVDHWCRIHGPRDDVSMMAVELRHREDE